MPSIADEQTNEKKKIIIVEMRSKSENYTHTIHNEYIEEIYLLTLPKCILNRKTFQSHSFHIHLRDRFNFVVYFKFQVCVYFQYSINNLKYIGKERIGFEFIQFFFAIFLSKNIFHRQIVDLNGLYFVCGIFSCLFFHNSINISSFSLY